MLHFFWVTLYVSGNACAITMDYPPAFQIMWSILHSPNIADLEKEWPKNSRSMKHSGHNIFEISVASVLGKVCAITMDYPHTIQSMWSILNGPNIADLEN